MIKEIPSTARVEDLRKRVRAAMEREPEGWPGPERIDAGAMDKPVGIRRALAIRLKLEHMPTDLWEGQLFAGSVGHETPHLHTIGSFPKYLSDEEQAYGREHKLGMGCFGHIAPDFPCLLKKGLSGIRADAEAQLRDATEQEESDFLESVIIALDAVAMFAERLAAQCETDAAAATDVDRAFELRDLAVDLRTVPVGPAQTFRQALQSVWLVHMIFQASWNFNSLGRADQYLWPYLDADLQAGRLDLAHALELVECWSLKFNERAKTTEDQLAEQRREEDSSTGVESRHTASSQPGWWARDRIDATNHWLQNIVLGGLTPEGKDGTNPLTFMILEAHHRNRMTNPVLTVRAHGGTPDELLRRTAEVLREGGGLPAIFNDDALVPAQERIGIPTADARDYTNDGCWEVIVPGRTDFRFQRVSPALCLEWALNRGKSRITGEDRGPDTGDPTTFGTFDDVWRAFETQMDAMVGGAIEKAVARIDDRKPLGPLPLLSALIDGCIRTRTDMSAGGAKFRTYGLIAESAAHAIDSLVAIKTVVFEEKAATMGELCDALQGDFEGYAALRRKLIDAPKYGNDDERADEVGRRVISAFTQTVRQHAEPHGDVVKFPCGVGTFSWYVPIGEGLAASADGRRAGDSVSPNFSPALGRDLAGIPAAILSYSRMHHADLPAGGPLDLRLSSRLVQGEAGTGRIVALIRSLVEAGGSMMTLSVVDVEELRAAQREPDKYKSLRVRMGGWSAYFTMLSREQQEHHIRRQGGRG